VAIAQLVAGFDPYELPETVRTPPHWFFERNASWIKCSTSPLTANSFTDALFK